MYHSFWNFELIKKIGQSILLEATNNRKERTLTYQEDFTLPTEYTPMQAGRQKYLGAGPYERTSHRQGYANGYEPKTVQTRVGNMLDDVPIGVSCACGQSSTHRFLHKRDDFCFFSGG